MRRNFFAVNPRSFRLRVSRRDRLWLILFPAFHVVINGLQGDFARAGEPVPNYVPGAGKKSRRGGGCKIPSRCVGQAFLSFPLILRCGLAMSDIFSSSGFFEQDKFGGHFR